MRYEHRSGFRAVVGLDHTIERRRGAQIAAKGIYHDPVRSSKSHKVKASGLRWVCLMLLVPIPWPQARPRARRATSHRRDRAGQVSLQPLTIP